MERVRHDEGTVFRAERHAAVAVALSYSEWLKDTVEYLEHDVTKAIEAAGMVPAAVFNTARVTVEVSRWAA